MLIWRSDGCSPGLECPGEAGVGVVEVGPSAPDAGSSERAGLAPGVRPEPNAWGGQVSFDMVDRAIADARRPDDDPLHADAIVTAPISKEAWDLAGQRAFPGHTEMLRDRFEAERVRMFFAGQSVRVILVTVHVPLAEACRMLTQDGVTESILMGADACRQLGVDAPRLAVCGLNPHAGENGLLGDEDARIIAPAVERARSSGVDVSGPFPGDTVFRSAVAPPFGAGAFDCVVAMYHDQGLVPVKLLDPKNAVNVTVGLPTIRTSPCHGTAFDIAGLNRAGPESMSSAIDLALTMATSR